MAGGVGKWIRDRNTALAISIAEDRGAVLKMLLKADGISIDSTSLVSLFVVLARTSVAW